MSIDVYNTTLDEVKKQFHNFLSLPSCLDPLYVHFFVCAIAINTVNDDCCWWWYRRVLSNATPCCVVQFCTWKMSTLCTNNERGFYRWTRRKKGEKRIQLDFQPLVARKKCFPRDLVRCHFTFAVHHLNSDPSSSHSRSLVNAKWVVESMRNSLNVFDYVPRIHARIQCNFPCFTRRQNKIKIRQRLFTRRGISAASVEEKFRFLLFSINIAVRRFSTLRNIIFMWYEKFIFELSEVYDHAEPFIIETIKKASERESRRPCVSFFRSLIRNIPTEGRAKRCRRRQLWNLVCVSSSDGRVEFLILFFLSFFFTLALFPSNTQKYY